MWYLRPGRWQKWSVWLKRCFCNPTSPWSGRDQRLVLHILYRRVGICGQTERNIKFARRNMLGALDGRVASTEWCGLVTLSTFAFTQFAPGTQRIERSLLLARPQLLQSTCSNSCSFRWNGVPKTMLFRASAMLLHHLNRGSHFDKSRVRSNWMNASKCCERCGRCHYNRTAFTVEIQNFAAKSQ